MSTTIYDAIVVGAGASGLTAAYEMIRNGLNIRLLEANIEIGGRMKKTDTFASFPLDLGASWIHGYPSQILSSIVNDPSVSINLNNIIEYVPEYYDWWGPDKKWYSETYEPECGNLDSSFLDYTWFDFFKDYIAPVSHSSLQLGCVVNQIDSRNSQYVKVSCKDGRQFRAKNVVVTASIAVLKRGDIKFAPSLPSYKTTAIQKVRMDPGMMVYFKFSHKFYYDAFEIYKTRSDAKRDGTLFFYDAAYGEDTSDNILGVLMNSEWAESYVSLSDVAIKDQLLSELNEFFQGQATLLYLDHKIMNWSKEPFIGGVFSNHDYSGTYNQISSIARPIANNRIYFAGEALEPDGWYGLVQGAASTGQSVARKITNKFK